MTSLIFIIHMSRKYVAKLPSLQAIQYFEIEGDRFWAVPSASDASKVYEVRQPVDKFTCNCPDYMTRKIGTGEECKHGKAVRALVDFKAKPAELVITP